MKISKDMFHVDEDGCLYLFIVLCVIALMATVCFFIVAGLSYLAMSLFGIANMWTWGVAGGIFVILVLISLFTH